MTFDLIVPLYNPQTGWEAKFLDHCTSLGRLSSKGLYDLNIIIINDGSTKGFDNEHITWLREQLPNITFLSYNENRGKGYALRLGVRQSITKYIIYSDFDFPFGPEAIVEVLELLHNGADIVTGRRTHGNYFSALPLKRRIASKGLAFFNKYILRLPVSDTQAGIKGFNTYGKALFLKTQTERFLFDLEFIMLSGQIKDISVKELDVVLRENTHISNFSRKVIRQELMNLARILFRKKDHVRWKKDLLT